MSDDPAEGPQQSVPWGRPGADLTARGEDLGGGTGYVPFSTMQKRDELASTVGMIRDDTTPQLWWIALSPTWFVMTNFVLVGFSLAAPSAGLVLSILPVGAAAFLFVLAVADRDGLARREGIRAASPFWMLLGPVGYLIARRFALRRYRIAVASAPLVVVVIQALIIGAVAGYWFAVEGLTRMAQ